MNNKLIAAIIAVIVIVAALGATYVLISQTPKDNNVYYTAMPVGNMKVQLSTNSSIGGYIAWEPFGSDGIVSGVGHALNWSGDVKPNHPCCVVLVSEDFLGSTNGTNLTIRFLQAHIEATKWIQDSLSDEASANYTKLVSMGVGFTGRNETVVKAAFEHVEFTYEIDQQMIDAIAWYTSQFVNISVLTNQSITGKGYSSAQDFADQYVEDSYLEQAEAASKNSTIMGTVRLGYLNSDIHQMAQVVARNETVFGSSSLFEQYGVEVVAASGAPYSSGPTEMDNFANGNVDIGYLGAPPAILKHLNSPGVEAQIIAQANTEGSALIVANDVQTLDDLRGRIVAIPAEGSIQYLLLQVIMREAGIPLVKA